MSRSPATVAVAYSFSCSMIQPQSRSPAAAPTLVSRAARTSRPHLGNENVPPPSSSTASKKSARGSGYSDNNALGWAPQPLPQRPAARGSNRALKDITNVAGSRAQGKSVVKQLSLLEATPIAKPPACATAAAEIVVAEDMPESKFSQQSVSEYVPDIFNLLFREEANSLPIANYMEAQADINGKMRAILVDWLVEVHTKYRLRQETLFLTVNLVDRYLSGAHVTRKRLQLVGVVALLIGAKFEEIDPPRVCDLVYITDNAYTKDDILVMECKMLTSLGLHIVVPTVAHFIDRFEHANRCDAQQIEVVQYVLELALLDLATIRYSPSCLAAAAVLLSNELQARVPAWPASMAILTRRSEQSLRACADELRALLEGATRNPLQAVRKKYMLEKHLCVGKTMCGSAVHRGLQ